jgi:hypothetical protein
MFDRNNTRNIVKYIYMHLHVPSSSSSALQPGVGFGLPSFLDGFVRMIVLQGGIVNPTPNPQLPWKTNVFCQGCLP